MHWSLPILTLGLLIGGCSCPSAPFPKTFLLTAYAAPILEASPVPTAEFATPLRSLPLTAKPYATRGAFAAGKASSPALAWIANPLDAYLAEVNGSVRLEFPNGSTTCLAWIATNERPYTSLGKLLVEGGHASPLTIDLGVIRQLHEDNPALIESLMLLNDRVVFFEAIECHLWPRASTGEVLRPMESIAVDPAVIPLGSRVRLTGEWADGTPLDVTAVAIDIGGAIQGARIDLYLGAGTDALELAGAQRQTVNVTILNP